MKLGQVMIFFLFLLNLGSCSGEKVESRSLEQIQREAGIPVRIRTIREELFTVQLRYRSRLQGIRETIVGAPVSDRVVEVSARVGDFVEEGQTVVRFPEDNPLAHYDQAKAALDHARKMYERLRKLGEEGGVSRQDLDNAETALRVAEADWRAVHKAVTADAPYSGIITRMDVLPSDNVHAEDPLFSLARMDRLRARVWITEKEVTEVSRGLTAYATVNGDTLWGKLVQLDLAPDLRHQAFRGVVELENPGVVKRLGESALVGLETYRNPRAVVVERWELLPGSEGPGVFVEENGRALWRAVTVGYVDGLRLEIVSGLQPGDRLIVEGGLLLSSGDKVKVITREP